MKNNFRYILEPYQATKKNRFTCPECDIKGVYTRYIDQATGERLPEKFGKCNRENNCGYFLHPYGQKKEGNEPISWRPKQANNERLKQAFLPSYLVKKSMQQNGENSLLKYLKTFLDSETIAHLENRFLIGSSKYLPGGCVFWNVDRAGQVHGGQVVSFDSEGHTVRKRLANGKKDRSTKWIHYGLKKAYKEAGKPCPGWLENYFEFKMPGRILFGLHQLALDPFDKTVCIVEAPKTAIIASAYLPQYTWLASGALSYLTYERIEALDDRKIILFPDKGAYQEWSRKAELWQGEFNIVVNDFMERIEAEPGADLADYLPQQNLHKFRREAEERLKPKYRLARHSQEQTSLF